jgi:Ras-related protein Rab-11B
MQEQDALFKVCIFGDGGVGKTTLVKRYLTGVFNGSSTMTIGVDFHIKNVEVEGHIVKLQIWDFAGEDRFRFLLPGYMIGASAGVFMYDITRYSSIKNVLDWLEVYKQGTDKEIPLIMVGGKTDLAHKRAVERDVAMNLAKSKGFYGFIECSAKSGENVEATFRALARILLEEAEML